MSLELEARVARRAVTLRRGLRQASLTAGHFSWA